MGKHRQPDFQKKRLRLLPKGKNITKTSFKSKKIVIKKQKGLDRFQSTNIDVKDLLYRISHYNDSSCYDALCHLKSHILRNRDTFTVHLPLIFNKVPRLLTDDKEPVRRAAVSTLRTVLVLCSDVEVDSYFPLLTSNLNCAMTHFSPDIRHLSLELLDVMLRSHADLVCHSMNVLRNLIDMISFKSADPNKKGKQKKRVLKTTISDTLSAQDYRFMVLQNLNAFLKAMLKAMENKQENDLVEDKEVIWSKKQPLCLPLYAGGGLKPVELESNYHWYLNFESTDSYCWRPCVVKECIEDIMPMLLEIFIEEILDYSIDKGCFVSPNTIERLNTLLSVLCQLGEWVRLISTPANDVKMWFAETFYQLHTRLMMGFPYFAKESQKSKNFDIHLGIQVNLSICWLHSAFMLEIEQPDSLYIREKILMYLKEVFQMDYETCYVSAPMLIGITKNYLDSSDIGTMIANLVGLYQILKVKITSVNHKLLRAFFLELSLNPSYGILSEIPIMESWFELILKELKEMKLSNAVDKSFLNDIRKISSRRYPHFLTLLDEITEDQYLELLCYEDEDFQETIIHLICLKSEISPFFLKKLAGLIYRKQFASLRFLSRIIRMLTCRFLQSSVSERSEYLKFLVNVACDTFSIDAVECVPQEIIDFLTEWKLVQPLCAYCIYPSTEWKNHSILYEVCTESLLQLFDEHKVKSDVTTYVETILTQGQHFPVHCLVAVCQMKKTFGLVDIQLLAVEKELVYAIVMYASMFSLFVKNGEMFKYSISVLFDSLNLNRKAVCYLLQMMDKDITENAHHIHQHPKIAIIYLRIVKFLMVQKLLTLEDRRMILPILEKFKKICNMESFHSLWMHICNFFGYF